MSEPEPVNVAFDLGNGASVVITVSHEGVIVDYYHEDDETTDGPFASFCRDYDEIYELTPTFVANHEDYLDRVKSLDNHVDL